MKRPPQQFDTPRDAAAEFYMNSLEAQIKVLTDVAVKLEKRAEQAEEALVKIQSGGRCKKR